MRSGYLTMRGEVQLHVRGRRVWIVPFAPGESTLAGALPAERRVSTRRRLLFCRCSVFWFGAWSSDVNRPLTCAAFVAALATGGCGSAPEQLRAVVGAGTSPAPRPVYVAGHPPCRVWDEDIFGRRYCRVRYVY